jgi:hypothetical protein
MNKIYEDLNIDQTFQQKARQPKKAFSTFKNNLPPVEDYNAMVDTLHLPKTKKGYAFLLVMIDLASNECDFEPMRYVQKSDKKPKKDAVTAEMALEAMLKIFKRKYLNKPFASISADGGPEFKGVFKKYCYENSILLRVGEVGRHYQSANVESLNRILGRLLNGYLNKMTIQKNKQYYEWVDILDIIREKLNDYRKQHTKKAIENVTYPVADITHTPKFNNGDLVYRLLDHPEDAMGYKQPTESFREGDMRWDRQPRKITQTFVFTGDQLYRYQLYGLPHVSYSEWQLKIAEGHDEELFEVRKFLKSRKVNNRIELLTWYYKELKKDASWQLRSEMMKHVPHLVKAYEKNAKKKK